MKFCLRCATATIIASVLFALATTGVGWSCQARASQGCAVSVTAW